MEEIPESGVPADVHIETVYPLLVASFMSRFIATARIVGNQYADIGLIDVTLPNGHAMAGKVIASIRMAFGETPLDTSVSEYWSRALSETARQLFEQFAAEAQKRMVTPVKALHGANGEVLRAVKAS